MDNTEAKAPPSAQSYARFGFGVIVAVFGGLILWSILAPIQGAVVASGQVTVESQRKVVQHLQGGTVEEILVREGQRVEAGELLVKLENTVAAANVALIDGQLTELYARRARLTAERDDLEELPEPRGVDAVIATNAFSVTVEGQKELFEARRDTRDTQISLLEERIVQQNERITGLNSQINSLGAQRRLINDELAGVRELNEQGFAPMTRVRALERESKRLDGERGSLIAAVAQAESVINEAKLEITRLREAMREEAITELRDVEVSISELEERRIAAADSLEKTEIRAPQAGRVLGLKVHTVGGVIAPGNPLMEIVPDNDRLEIAARVSPLDIDRVAVGQETLVRFSAFGGRRTPEATGVVKTVSADSMIDQNTGIPYFLVLIELPDEEQLARILSGRTLAPGMPTESFIRTGARPAISYFLKPLTDSLARSMREE